MPTNDNNDDVKYTINVFNTLRKHGRYGAYMNPQDSFNVPKEVEDTLIVNYRPVIKLDSYAVFDDSLVIRKIVERGLTNSQSRNINNNKHNQKTQLQLHQAKLVFN